MPEGSAAAAGDAPLLWAWHGCSGTGYHVRGSRGGIKQKTLLYCAVELRAALSVLIIFNHRITEWLELEGTLKTIKCSV